MKVPVLLMAVSIVILIAACKKDHYTPIPSSAAYLFGDWQLIAVYSSTGAMGSWSPASSNEKASFSSSGRFSATDMHFNAYRIDSVSSGVAGAMKALLVLYKTGKAEDEARYDIRRTANDTLELWYQSCYEGCGIKYVRRR
ncbi:hypothetical protein [Chitinophaga rhizophila]|uniref:Lipocalin-like domain-containing protein n=1 Tax=Chitinophaga rhizophila TaxID=2866212 RepID=A0ABS7GBI3_9BACT|nr:hypothetical protein [Chitinophaga rhizophila]MBW8685032.1 hypothetical protein [Chitinophaga rhizophila]